MFTLEMRAMNRNHHYQAIHKRHILAVNYMKINDENSTITDTNKGYFKNTGKEHKTYTITLNFIAELSTDKANNKKTKNNNEKTFNRYDTPKNNYFKNIMSFWKKPHKKTLIDSESYD